MPRPQPKLYRAITLELKYTIPMRIAATLHAAGITEQQWIDLSGQDPYTLLPRPAVEAIHNHIRDIDRGALASVPGLPSVAKALDIKPKRG